jgi:hypothetical protein
MQVTLKKVERYQGGCDKLASTNAMVRETMNGLILSYIVATGPLYRFNLNICVGYYAAGRNNQAAAYSPSCWSGNCRIDRNGTKKKVNSHVLLMPLYNFALFFLGDQGQGCCFRGSEDC